MDIPDMPDFSSLGWVGWVGMALVSAFVYFPKVWKESRSEDRENDRLQAALNEERNLHKETREELKAERATVAEQVTNFAKMNADNATLVERMDH
ncbi:hypothetical protein, partial [Escherichia coli]|uniref:hypothetical protein n=1 Tax=Escherichia coli TaxID=562 RepID=UPI0013282849